MISMLRRWTIRARVTNKSGIRTWSNSRGEGKLFSMDLVDESVRNNCLGFSFNMSLWNRVYLRFDFGIETSAVICLGRDQSDCVHSGGGQILLAG